MIRNVVLAVLDAQREYSSENTEAMRHRGGLVRKDMVAWATDLLPDLRAVCVADLAVDASDGKGLRSEIPWMRVHSASQSPSATDGWYVVYLFDAPGESVFLTLMQGTTTWTNGYPVTRPLRELRARGAWARERLADAIAARTALSDTIALRGRASKRAKGYEAGIVVALEYPRATLPQDDVLRDDLVFMTSLLGRLYAIAPTDDRGDTQPIDSDTLLIDSDTLPIGTGDEPVVVTPGGGGQGFGLDGEARRAVEARAVRVALDYLAEQGYTATDVGLVQSYDIDARRGDERLYVEVKGTISGGAEVILTRNEVDLHRREYPNTMLIVVSGIVLTRTPVTATGGRLAVWHPWRIDVNDLRALSYQYRVDDGAAVSGDGGQAVVAR